jgi:lysophospholipase L1-like esterase
MSQISELLWDRTSGEVYGEAILFRENGCSKPAFRPESIISVRRHATGELYREGVDYIFDAATGTITLLPGSRIPVTTEEELFPPEGSKLYPDPDAIAIGGGPGGKLIRFSHNRFFQDRVVDVDYVTREELPQIAALPAGKLPRFQARLKDNSDEPVRITVIGDSITEGLNASGYQHFPPGIPNYIDQFQFALSRATGKIVMVDNQAISGTGCRHADKIEERWLKGQPDLLIAAYGMNDYGMKPEEFIQQNLHIIEQGRKLWGDKTEYLLVLPMTGNPDWEHTPSEAADAFADAEREFVAKQPADVALADVRELWCNILARKSFNDMTSNGVNHPNDYGHTLYASALLSLFV